MNKVFGKYRIAAPITIGSPNAAYQARSITGFEWNKVVKVYATRPVHLPEEEEAFCQYMAMLSQLEHPHILPITDYGIEKNIPFYVTEYMAYGSLRERLEHKLSVQLSLQERITIIAQVGRALQYAHAHHSIHGNIKPENILFNKNNDVLLTDFYLPENIGKSFYGGLNNAQSPYYQAFEDLNEKSDQYALGYLADELFGELMPKANVALVSPPAQYAREEAALHPTFEVSKQVRAMLLKAMDQEPDKRYQDIAEFVDALNEVYAAQSMITLSSSIMLPPTLPASNGSYSSKTLQGRPILSRWGQYPQGKHGSARGPLLIAIVLLLFGILSVGLIWQFSLAQFLQKYPSGVVPQGSPGTVTIVTPGLAQIEPTLVGMPTVSSTVVPSTAMPKISLSPTVGPAATRVAPPSTTNPATTPIAVILTPSPAASASPAPVVPTPVVPTQPAILALSCHVDYKITFQWNGGFQASITISNTSTVSVNSWHLQWSFGSDQKITEVWNANILQSGQNVTMSNASWNGSIPPGTATSSIGLSGTYTVGMSNPSNFILNGTVCN